MDDEMYVTKRSGNREIVSFDKILTRIKKIGEEVNIKINYTSLVMKVIDQLYDGISTTKIDELTAEQCASLSSTHPDYNILSGRITISNHHKNTSASFSDVITRLYNYKDKHGKSSQLVSSELYNNLVVNAEQLESICNYERDYLIDYFGFKTLERAYLMKIDRTTVERPQHMWLRVAMGIHGDNMERIKETYEYMSQKYFTHATPTLFNSGTPRQQNSSCFLLSMEGDSVDGIYNTLKDCALISKWAGGIGLHIHNVRASGSHIRGTNGSSNGIVPMLKVFNNTAKYIDQCVHPDTIIYTTAGPTRIKDCVPGITQIFNKSGGIETIGQVLEHAYHGGMLEVQLFDLPANPLWITPEHPVCVVQYSANMRADIDAGNVNMEWLDANELRVGDMVVFPVPTFEADHNRLTEKICYIYGLILSGILVDSTMKKTCMEIKVKHEDYVLIALAEFLAAQCVEFVRTEDMITFGFGPNIPFCMSDFFQNGTLNIGKRWLFLPKHKVEIIFEGMQPGITMTDEMAKSIQFMKLRIADMGPDSKVYNGNILVPIKNIRETTEYEGLLYDLQMTHEHNYLIENGLVHNGGGKRNGSFAIYLEPWHADIEMFLQMRKNHGDEELKARDLFYALWIPDLFMERVKADGLWTLMCPDECPGLADVYGKEFVELYTKYENGGLTRKTVKARDLWFQILDAQMETGTPYILYKDAANEKSNQKNIGTIKSSNLCVAPETFILTDKGYVEIASVAGQMVNVWNGHEFSEVEIVKTGEDQELMEVFTDDGCSLVCTPYHKFFVGQDSQTVDAQDLAPGDVLSSCKFPSIESSIESNMVWLSRFCAEHGYRVPGEVDIVLSSSAHELLMVKLIMQTFGIDVKIAGDSILLDHLTLYKLSILGFTLPLHELVSVPESCRPREIQTKIRFTQRLTRRDATYCFTEPKRHAGIFNGIYTSQCTEVIQVSTPEETAVCNLASIALPTFVKTDESGTHFDYEKLHEVTKIVTYNLNRVIDVNYYPTPKTKLSNMRHRPIGIGVQGLADVFIMMGHPFASDESKLINKHIFETIYHGALEQSCDLAETDGEYETFRGSPASFGELQFDMWNVERGERNVERKVKHSNDRYNWTELKARIQKHGLRNSLLLAPMPTASTSQILGFNECIEPITSNIYNRRTIAGEFILANKYLMNDLIKLDLWNEKIKNNIIANHGSVQHIDVIPQHIRDKYKTVWEIPMRNLIDMAADRGIYICQSQSLNLWLEDPNYNSLTSMHFYSWSRGLKTGIYYLRRRGRHQAQQFTIEPTKTDLGENSLYEEEICEMCSA